MDMNVLHSKLIHAVTRYDRAQEKRRDYNPYALSQYIDRIHDVIQEIEAGKTIEQALEDNFNDRLLTALQKAVK